MFPLSVDVIRRWLRVRGNGDLKNLGIAVDWTITGHKFF
jgi:hypothetical protein